MVLAFGELHAPSPRRFVLRSGRVSFLKTSALFIGSTYQGGGKRRGVKCSIPLPPASRSAPWVEPPNNRTRRKLGCRLLQKCTCNAPRYVQITGRYSFVFARTALSLANTSANH